MRLAVLASSDSWYLRNLIRAAGDRHEIVRATYRDLSVDCVGHGETALGITSGDVPLTKCDGLLVRTMPPGSLEQIVFRMDALAYLAERIPVVNPPRAIEAAVDKFLCTARLARAGIPTPRTIVAQTPEQALRGFAELGGRAVIKPLFGSEGRGIALLEDEALAARTFDLLAGLGSVIYLQEFIPHGESDYRVLIVGERTWTMRRRHASDWRTNLARGATAEPCALPDDVLDLARARRRSWAHRWRASICCSIRTDDRW
ncbi:MAG: hypothetical protein QM811_08705 [Pirellulales bacterium]